MIYLPKCHSTNDIATQILNQPSTSEGTVVITDCQENGRGQRGNIWESQPFKNLTFSVILKPSALAPKDQFYLNMAISLGVHYAVREFTGHDVAIKWPNDVMVAGQKIAGILIENHWQGSRLTSCIVGIGINVNQESFSVPTATSMVSITGAEQSLQEVLESTLSRLEAMIIKLREGKTAELSEAYHGQLYGRGKELVFSSHGNTFRGTILRVRPDGRIVLSIANREKDFATKEIAIA